MSDIRIYMCCHKPFSIVPPMCTPLQCGAALNGAVEGAEPDDTGVNISGKNREYCELTAHFYAWKNVRAEHYGFCHYRRFFSVGNNIRHPYLAVGKLSEKQKLRFLGDDEYWEKRINEYQLIVPRAENMGIPAREHYCSSKYHYADDLALFIKLLKCRAPQLAAAADEYLSQNTQYFCNMFIMSRPLFMEYCETLFSILEEFDSQKTMHEGFQANRTDGYLGEVFTGIFIFYQRTRGTRILELPRLDIDCSVKKRIVFLLFPPESRRRFWAKGIVKKLFG